jgi:hypothetical protein
LRTTFETLLIVLALIVQILAPVGSGAASVRLAFDPLVDIIVCAQDQDTVDRRDATNPVALHHGDACGLCRLAAPGGFAPPVEIALAPPPVETARPAAWRIAVEAVVLPRLLDRIRARAPPSLSRDDVRTGATSVAA